MNKQLKSFLSSDSQAKYTLGPRSTLYPLKTPSSRIIHTNIWRTSNYYKISLNKKPSHVRVRRPIKSQNTFSVSVSTVRNFSDYLTKFTEIIKGSSNNNKNDTCLRENSDNILQKPKSSNYANDSENEKYGFDFNISWRLKLPKKRNICSCQTTNTKYGHVEDVNKMKLVNRSVNSQESFMNFSNKEVVSRVQSSSDDKNMKDMGKTSIIVSNDMIEEEDVTQTNKDLITVESNIPTNKVGRSDTSQINDRYKYDSAKPSRTVKSKVEIIDEEMIRKDNEWIDNLLDVKESGKIKRNQDKQNYVLYFKTDTDKEKRCLGPSQSRDLSTNKQAIYKDTNQMVHSKYAKDILERLLLTPILHDSTNTITSSSKSIDVDPDAIDFKDVPICNYSYKHQNYISENVNEQLSESNCKSGKDPGHDYFKPVSSSRSSCCSDLIEKVYEEKEVKVVDGPACNAIHVGKQTPELYEQHYSDRPPGRSLKGKSRSLLIIKIQDTSTSSNMKTQTTDSAFCSSLLSDESIKSFKTEEHVRCSESISNSLINEHQKETHNDSSSNSLQSRHTNHEEWSCFLNKNHIPKSNPQRDIKSKKLIGNINKPSDLLSNLSKVKKWRGRYSKTKINENDNNSPKEVDRISSHCITDSIHNYTYDQIQSHQKNMCNAKLSHNKHNQIELNNSKIGKNDVLNCNSQVNKNMTENVLVTPPQNLTTSDDFKLDHFTVIRHLRNYLTNNIFETVVRDPYLIMTEDDLDSLIMEGHNTITETPHNENTIFEDERNLEDGDDDDSWTISSTDIRNKEQYEKSVSRTELSKTNECKKCCDECLNNIQVRNANKEISNLYVIVYRTYNFLSLSLSVLREQIRIFLELLFNYFRLETFNPFFVSPICSTNERNVKNTLNTITNYFKSVMCSVMYYITSMLINKLMNKVSVVS